MRRGVLRTFVFVLGAVALAAVPACSGTQDPGRLAAPLAQDSPGAEAEGEIEIVDYGFSAIPLGGDAWALSYGVVLRNAGADAASLTTVTATATTSSGEPVGGLIPRSVQHYLAPGATVGLGATVPAVDVGLDELPGDLVFEVKTREWVSADDDAYDFPAFTASDVALVRAGDGSAEITFTGTVADGPKTIGSMSAIFRDAAGRLVGGAESSDVEGGLGLTSGPMSLRLEWGAAEGASRAEVYVNAYF